MCLITSYDLEPCVQEEHLRRVESEMEFIEGFLRFLVLYFANLCYILSRETQAKRLGVPSSIVQDDANVLQY